MKMTKRPCGARRIGEGESRRQTECLKPMGNIVEELVLAAKEMGSAGDIEEETVAAVFLAPYRDGRRIAHRPQCQTTKCRFVGLGVEGAHLQAFGFGPRIGRPFAYPEPHFFGCYVGSGNDRLA